MLATLLLAAATPARADPSLSDRETARSLMDDGDAKRDKGDFKSALKSYEAADAIMRVPTTGLEVARTQAQLGLLLEARETLGRVMRLPPRPGEPPPFTAARKTAEQLSTELGARLPSVTVVVTNGEAGQPIQVTFDGEVVPPAAVQAPRKVNPGAHTIVARSGSLEKKEQIAVNERDVRTVTLDLKPAAAAPEPPKIDEQPSSALPKILVFGGFGLGLVGVGVGTVTGLMSISQVNDVRKDCVGDVCKPSRQSDIDAAQSLGTISTVAFIVGGAGIAAGVIGLVLSGKQSTEPPPGTSAKGARPTFVPDVGPTWVGAHGTF
jgi:hypothetical protein